MPFLNICNDDELVNTLRSVFRCNIVRIPEQRIQPLSVIAKTSSQTVNFWGQLNELLSDDIPSGKIVLQNSRMADVSAKRSKKINIDIGLDIMDGFLRGFSLPSASISEKFSGAKTISFSFQDVNRSYISPAYIGNLVKNLSLNESNKANDIFIEKKARFLLIDSIITSKDFSIKVEDVKSNDFSLNIKAIKEMVLESNAAIKVSSSSDLDIKFQGDIALTFAFTCIECLFDDAYRISIKHGPKNVNFSDPQDPNHEFLSDDITLIDFI